MSNKDIAREKILNDMQRKVLTIIYEDDVKNAKERNEVLAYFKQALKLAKKWDIYQDSDEFEQNFEIQKLRINPEYKSRAIVESNWRRKNDRQIIHKRKRNI